MIITNAGYELVNEQNPTKKIERIARICYKSEDKITEGSDIKIIENLISHRHTAMLEHANIILDVSPITYKITREKTAIRETFVSKEERNHNCYLRFSESTPYGTKRFIISGNLRAWYEYFEWLHCNSGIDASLFSTVNAAANSIFNRFSSNISSSWGSGRTYLLKPENLTAEERMTHELFTAVFTVDRGITHELVRMREASFAQESTRYCNYSKNKFGNEITVIKPCFADWDKDRFDLWKDACRYSEKRYFDLLDAGATPQEARDVLPTSVKSEIAVTANLNEWHHIFNLRACDATGPAHPQMHEVMRPLLLEQQKLRPFAFDDLKIPD